jgi:hypothetical protein
MADDDKLGEVLEYLREQVDEGEQEDRWEQAIRENNTPEALQAYYQDYCTGNTFSLGQLVEWKLNMKNRRLPLPGQPAIVVEILPTPVLVEDESSGSPYFREKLDIVLGMIDSDGEFLRFHFNSRLFKPYDPGERGK